VFSGRCRKSPKNRREISNQYRLFNRSINRAGSSQDSGSEEAAILGETGMSVLQRVLRMESHKAP